MTVSESDGTQDLRRSLRDLVALSMLPTIWARYDPRQICADLVDVVSRMIDADGVYLTSPLNGCPDLLRLRKEGDREIESSLRAATAEALPGIHLLSSPLSFQTTDRFVVASRFALGLASRLAFGFGFGGRSPVAAASRLSCSRSCCWRYMACERCRAPLRFP